MKRVVLLCSLGVLFMMAAIQGLSTAFFMPKMTSAYAQTSSVISQTYENVSWTLDTTTGALTVTGEGEIAGMAGTDLTAWHDYAEAIQTVTVSDGIIGLGVNAFKELPNVTSVTLGKDVETIGASAFRGCTSLQTIRLPASLHTLKESAFSQSGLREIILNDGLETIGNRVFYECNHLQYVHIPDSVTKLGNYAFYHCKNLQEAVIGNGVTEIDKYTFEGCTKLAKAVIGNAVETVHERAFFGNTALTNLVFGDHVKTIGEYAFCGCSSLENLYFSDSITALEAYAFGSCVNLKTVHFGAQFTSFENTSITYAGTLKAVYVRSSVMASGLKNANAFNNLVRNVLTIAVLDGVTVHEYVQQQFGYQEQIKFKDFSYTAYGKEAHHAWKAYEESSGSCQEAGFQGERCENCQLMKGKEVFKHKYVYQPTDKETHEIICAICSEKTTSSHTWDGGKQVSAPTHTEEGRIHFTCQDCGFVDVELIAKLLEHTYGEWQVIKESTCTENGSIKRTCPCGETETQETTSLGHDYKNQTFAVTCEVAGYVLHTCTRCAHTYKDAIVQPKGHTYTNAQDFTCNVCGATRELTVPSNPGDLSPSNPSGGTTQNGTQDAVNGQSPDDQVTFIYSEKALKTSVWIGALASVMTTAILFGGWHLFLYIRKRISIRKSAEEPKEPEVKKKNT